MKLTNSIRAKANEREVRLGGNEKLVIRHSWLIQSRLNLSQLQDELCSSIIFLLIFSFSTPARLTVLAPFYSKDTELGDGGAETRSLRANPGGGSYVLPLVYSKDSERKRQRGLNREL